MAKKKTRTKAELRDDIAMLEAENSTLQEIVDDLSSRMDTINALTLDDDIYDDDEDRPFKRLLDRVVECEKKVRALQDTWNTKAEQIFSDMEAMLKQKYQIKDS